MAYLVACLSTGKGTWGHVGRLITDGQWEKIFLITNKFGQENFTNNKGAEMIVVESQGLGIAEMRDIIESSLKGKIKDTEVSLNLVSGSGKEHMAIVSAMLKLGLGIRFIALTKDGIKEV